MNVIANNDKVERLLSLLGPSVLLPWPSGSKGDRRKWKHLQLTNMDEPAHMAKLRTAGNVGVALGQVSNGLVTIDLDQDSYVDSLLAANPLLRDTLRTAAERGCNIWLRLRGEYPGSCYLTDPAGSKIGEWRADGNQTIIAGSHPSGCAYRFVVEKPVTAIDYDAIIWPDTILPPHATERVRE